MGLDTQAVIAGHPLLDDLCESLAINYGASIVQKRPTRSADYWIVELIEGDGQIRSINVFLNSFANGDVAELGLAQSTMLTLELCQTSEAILAAMAKGHDAWLRRHDNAPWLPQQAKQVS
jgi:hypothetical protein